MITILDFLLSLHRVSGEQLAWPPPGERGWDGGTITTLDWGEWDSAKMLKNRSENKGQIWRWQRSCNDFSYTHGRRMDKNNGRQSQEPRCTPQKVWTGLWVGGPSVWIPPLLPKAPGKITHGNSRYHKEITKKKMHSMPVGRHRQAQ